MISLEYDDTPGSELVVFSSEISEPRRLKLFAQTSAKNFESFPRTTIELPPSIFGVQCLDWDNDRRQEILLLGLEGIYLLEFDKGSYGSSLSTVISYERLFSIPNPGFISEYQFVQDLTNDGNPELTLPCWNGIRVLQKKNATYQLVRQLSLDYQTDGANHLNLLGAGVSFGPVAAVAFDRRFSRVFTVPHSDRGGFCLAFRRRR